MFKVAPHGKRVVNVNDPPLPIGSWRRWTSHLGAVHANPDAPKKKAEGARPFGLRPHDLRCSGFDCFGLLLFDFGPDHVHIDFTDLLHELVERLGWKHSGLGKDSDAVAKHHQGRN